MINNQFIDCLKLIDGITIHTGDAIGADYCHDEYPGGILHLRRSWRPKVPRKLRQC